MTHTKGELYYETVCDGEGNVISRGLYSKETGENINKGIEYELFTEEDARFIVACWNAVGDETAVGELEAMPFGGVVAEGNRSRDVMKKQMLKIQELQQRVDDAESVIDAINSLRDKAYDEIKQQRGELATAVEEHLTFLSSLPMYPAKAKAKLKAALAKVKRGE